MSLLILNYNFWRVATGNVILYIKTIYKRGKIINVSATVTETYSSLGYHSSVLQGRPNFHSPV